MSNILKKHIYIYQFTNISDTLYIRTFSFCCQREREREREREMAGRGGRGGGGAGRHAKGRGRNGVWMDRGMRGVA